MEEQHGEATNVGYEYMTHDEYMTHAKCTAKVHVDKFKELLVEPLIERW